MLEPEVRLLLQRVPEVADRYLALVDSVDGDPGAAATLAVLGDMVSDVAARLAGLEPLLRRALAAVEEVASESEDAEELVAGAFLDGLSPDDLRLLGPWFGPATRAALDGLELPCRRPEGRDEGRPQGRPSSTSLERHRFPRAAPGGTSPG